jgi:Tfp pilus assembly protein PilF
MPRSGITGLVDEAKSAGRLDDAERVLERMRPSLADDAVYHAAWGLLQESRGDLGAALASYERALAIDPLDHLSVEQKTTVLRRLGRESEARDFLTRSFHRATSVSAMNQVAVVALRQRWPADAERLLREVLESDPGNPGVLANLAAALGQQGKMGEATTVMREAVERDPSNAGNYFNLGAMLAAQNRPGEALAAFEAAIERGLRTPRVYVAAAKMRFQLGDAAGSERDLRRALDIEPSDAEARELLQILRSGGAG